MSDKNKMSKPYFSHDIASRGDIKIKRLLHEQGYEGYGIYWAVIECLHENKLLESDIEVLADDLRIPVEKLERVLKTELFVWEDGEIFSNRVNRNLNIQQEKAEKARKSAFARYKKDSKEDFIKLVIGCYEKIFGKEIVLSDENRQLIKDLSQKNNISIDTWQKIFENAKRGWNLPDGSHKTPSLKTIFENWDSFANDDYYLAPNYNKSFEDRLNRKQETFIDETDSLNSKKQAIEFIKSQNLTPQNPVTKKLRKKFSIDESEVFYDEKSA